MKISCHIIEDEPLASNLLVLYANKLSVLDLVGVSSNPLQAIESLKTNPVDLIFLDIQMPDMTGIALLKVLQKKPLVIFTTAYSEFALESYELDVVDYLKKPITFERFLKAVDKAEQRLYPTIAAKEKFKETDFIFVKDGTRFVKVMVSEILYIEGLKNYVAIHTATQKIISLQRLKSMQDQLPSDKFIRVHNSYIISKSSISSVKENEVDIGIAKIPIGETYLKSFMEFIDRLHIH
ncbi:MAG TPA: response regulator transcription factor [Nitrosopumilaceae archaeon]|jgi:two-component system LytT family response regulator|nr:response regulator transcription factor [Nitrosopumilaceae archaeon]